MKQEISELNGKLRIEKMTNNICEDRISRLDEQQRPDRETNKELRERIDQLERIQTKGRFYKAKKEHLP